MVSILMDWMYSDDGHDSYWRLIFSKPIIIHPLLWTCIYQLYTLRVTSTDPKLCKVCLRARSQQAHHITSYLQLPDIEEWRRLLQYMPPIIYRYVLARWLCIGIHAKLNGIIDTYAYLCWSPIGCVFIRSNTHTAQWFRFIN